MYCVPERLSEGLVDLPESGMGYQLVRVESKGDARRFVILNAEWAIAAGTDWQLVEDADIRFLGNHDHIRGPGVRVYRPVDRMNAPAAIREAEPFPYTLGELKVELHGSFPAISGDDVFYRQCSCAARPRPVSASLVAAWSCGRTRQSMLPASTTRKSCPSGDDA